MNAAELATATPVEIDTKLAELAGAYYRLKDRVAGVMQDVHYALGEQSRYITRNRLGWPTTNDEAEAKCREIADPEAWHHDPAGKAHRVVAKLDELRAAISANLGEQAPYNEEFNRRPWSRFYSVQDGHIHRSRSCSTCNKGNSLTRFGWFPELSGKSDDEALATFAAEERAWVLCTVCFPDAPVLPTERPGKHCEGSRKAPVEGTVKGNWQSSYGECTGCHERRVLAGGVLKAHRPAKPAAK